MLYDAEQIVTDLESAEGLGVKIPDQTVDRIADCCDIVIHNGVGILKGEILTKPQYGVLSYHHGDIRSYRGGAPAGFWQHLNDEEYVGVTLQRLNEQLDAGEIVSFSEIFIDDADTWYEVQKRMYSASVPMLKDGIETVRNPDTEPTTVPESDLGKIYYRSDWTMWARLRSRLKDFMQSYSP
jgi:methionyl-tRNA formyltransferase